MLFHYTTIEAATSIANDGLIRSNNLQLFRDMMCQIPGPLVGPFVWMTKSVEPEPTIVVKNMLANIDRKMPLTKPFYLVRIAVDPEMVGHRIYNMRQMIEQVGIKHSEFKWAIATAMAAGANPDEWRITMRSIERNAIVGYENVECTKAIQAFVSKMNVNPVQTESLLVP